MNRAEEAHLAWALIDSVTSLASKGTRAHLCIQVGAGDQDSAIIAVLELYARTRTKMPSELRNAVDSWIGGYRGAEHEPFLLDLFSRISLVDNDSQAATQSLAPKRSVRVDLPRAPRPNRISTTY